MSILQAPNILVIQLKRFGGIFGGKIDKAISFGEILVLSNFMSKASKVQDSDTFNLTLSVLPVSVSCAMVLHIQLDAYQNVRGFSAG
jgi:hypothetical protein